MSNIPAPEHRHQFLMNILLTVLTITLVSMIILNRETFNLRTFLALRHTLFPCQAPITYSLDRFDNRFDITQEEFIRAITDAETIWESAVDKDLFKPVNRGLLKISLVYDYRQAGTEYLNDLGLNIENNNQDYDVLKTEYDNTYAVYLAQKTELDSVLKQHEAHVAEYNTALEESQKLGGASPKEFRELDDKRQALNAETDAINTKVGAINTTADAVNVLADSLNNLADRLNITAERYNTIGDSLGDEFIEGTFGASTAGQEINIYQFDDYQKLVRVLAHELGHALGLEHVEDPDAIMYRLNESENDVATEADIAALKQLCKIE